ncbi:hypothetical protein [Paenibacillus sp. FSL H3-0333]|uniref:hypothetical protein n=1 Tax=Paenibacillus sp. FSL H3-0333 TaxID=2921373 RepID=UPI0030FA8CF0
MLHHVIYMLNTPGQSVEKKVQLRGVPEFTTEKEFFDYLQQKVAEIEGVSIKNIRIVRCY